jgi:uncharacterized membrane protein (UPF0127 family)
LIEIRNTSRGSLVADRVAVADSSGARRTGLLRHERLTAGEGLWIVPCEAVHTFGMKFAIDVVFLSRKQRVLKIRESMPRRRISVCLRAHSVLELASGQSAATGLAVGDQLEIVKVP